MLIQFYKLTCLFWIGNVLLGFSQFIIKKNRFLTLLQLSNIGVALLTMIMGIMEITNNSTGIYTVPILFFGHNAELGTSGISGFFVLLTGISYFAVSCFSLDYFRNFTQDQQRKVQCLMPLFVFSMLLVFSANDPFLFLFSWELMTIASYFLVVSITPDKAARKAGFLYLVIAHIGFFAITAGFFLLFSHVNFHAWNFDAITAFSIQSRFMANTLFLTILFGFGAKAGFFPLHVWLPEAHPAAPSPVSALMSSVMLLTAIYGLFRFVFEFLLAYQQLWWGYSLIGIGLVTMLVAVIHAAVQTDIKRLLAYSSMENMGLIATALGLAILFYQDHQYTLSDLALVVVFMHSLNHAVFKTLLFLAGGSILHATGERNLGRLGGLIHYMPWVSAFALVGTLAMAGLPLFNGFISEWLYLSIFFHASINHFGLAIITPLIIGISILVFGLAGFVAIKFFGTAFLGQPRELQPVTVHHSTWTERWALLFLAVGCVVPGLWPNTFIFYIQGILIQTLPALKNAAITNRTLLQFNFQTGQSHGFNPAVLVMGLTAILFITFICIRRLSPWPIRRADSWNCGNIKPGVRMQDTAEGFSQPFEQLFSDLMVVKLRLPDTGDLSPHYVATVTEKIWNCLYFPLVRVMTKTAAITRYFQQGRITVYLSYIGITLLVLLIWVVWA